MIQAIVQEELTDPKSLAVILLQVSRKHSYKYDEEVVDRSPSLRKELTKSIMAEVKAIAPYASKEQWSEAAGYLAERG